MSLPAVVENYQYGQAEVEVGTRKLSGELQSFGDSPGED